MPRAPRSRTPRARTTLAGTKLVERPWDCPRCGAHGVIVRHLRRRRRWRRERPDEVAPEHWEAQDEATRMLALIKCPVCLEHAPRAVLWSGLRLFGAALGATILAGIASSVVILFGDVSMAGLLAWIAGASALGAAREARRWRAASRSTVLRLQPGPPENRLPRAVVHRLALPPAVVPVESSAPEPVEQADDASGPRFLHPE